jgi:SAM-dependent methyltransferase
VGIEHYYNEHFARSSTHSSADIARAQHICRVVPAAVRDVLEVGAGSGLVARELAKDHAVSALELTETGVAQLRASGISATKGSIADLPYGDRCFDLVLASEVLEHLDLATYRAGIREIARVARHYVLVTVPNAEHLAAERQECPECRSIVSPWTHLRSFSNASLFTLFKGQGLATDSVESFGPWVPDLTTLRARLAFMHRAPSNPLRPGFLCSVCGYRQPGTPFARPARGELLSHPLLSLSYALDAVAVRASPKKRRWLLALYKRRPE